MASSNHISIDYGCLESKEQSKKLRSNQAKKPNDRIGRLEADNKQLNNRIGQLEADNKQLNNHIDQLEADNKQLSDVLTKVSFFRP